MLGIKRKQQCKQIINTKIALYYYFSAQVESFHVRVESPKTTTQTKESSTIRYITTQKFPNVIRPLTFKTSSFLNFLTSPLTQILSDLELP